MANVRRLGFRPSRVSGGGTVTYRKSRVLTNNTLAIAKGDAVKFAATGDVVAAAAGADELILQASVSNGAIFTDTLGVRRESKALPAATLYTSTGAEPENASYVYIVDNCVNVTFENNVANSAIALTDLNLNYPVVLTTLNATTLLSRHELNATGRAVTATIPWRVVEFVRRADNDISLVDCKVLCMLNAGQQEPALSINLGT